MLVRLLLALLLRLAMLRSWGEFICTLKASKQGAKQSEYSLFNMKPYKGKTHSLSVTKLFSTRQKLKVKNSTWRFSQVCVVVESTDEKKNPYHIMGEAGGLGGGGQLKPNI